MNQVTSGYGSFDAVGDRPWHVVRVSPQRLPPARLRVSILAETYVPLVPSPHKRSDSNSFRPRPLFSGYLFARFYESETPWRALREIAGVIQSQPLLRFGADPPVTLTDAEIAQIRELEQMRAVPVDRMPEIGDRVMGPCGIEGLLTRDIHGHWWITAEILHRPVRVEYKSVSLAA